MKAEIPPGYVACRSKSGRTKLHLMKVDLTTTVCGRYSLDRILPEDSVFTHPLRECGACRCALDRSGTSTITQRKTERPGWVIERTERDA